MQGVPGSFLCGLGLLLMQAHAANADFDLAQGEVLIQEPGTYRIFGTTSNHGIVIDADGEVEVVLDHATVDLEGTTAQALVVKKGNLTLYLSGANRLVSGSGNAVYGAGTVTIDDYRAPDHDDGMVGSLWAQSAAGGGGIVGNVRILGGEIGAYGSYGPGVGPTLRMEGGSLTAHGGSFSAGIGGSKGGSGNVEIDGGRVVAYSGSYAACIGGGQGGSGGRTTIRGGSLYLDDCHASGIGGGFTSSATTPLLGSGKIRWEGGMVEFFRTKTPFGSQVTASWDSLTIVGGALNNGPQMYEKFFDRQRSNGEKSVHMLRLQGLPHGNVDASLSFSSPSGQTYGMHDVEGNIRGAADIFLPEGSYTGTLRVGGTDYPFSTTVEPGDTNTIWFGLVVSLSAQKDGKPWERTYDGWQWKNGASVVEPSAAMSASLPAGLWTLYDDQGVGVLNYKSVRDSSIYELPVLHFYSVFFIAPAAMHVETEVILSGRKAVMPLVDAITDCDFLGWFTDDSYTKPWDPNEKAIYQTTFLYAQTSGSCPELAQPTAPVTLDLVLDGNAWDGSPYAFTWSNRRDTIVAMPGQAQSLPLGTWMLQQNGMPVGDSLDVSSQYPLDLERRFTTVHFVAPVNIADQAFYGHAVEPSPTLAAGCRYTWFSDADFQYAWDFAKFAVLSETTLYAKEECGLATWNREGRTAIPEVVRMGADVMVSGLSNGTVVVLADVRGHLVAKAVATGGVVRFTLPAAKNYLLRAGNWSYTVSP